MAQMNLFAEQELRCRPREWMDEHGLGERGWDELGDGD